MFGEKNLEKFAVYIIVEVIPRFFDLHFHFH